MTSVLLIIKLPGAGAVGASVKQEDFVRPTVGGGNAPAQEAFIVGVSGVKKGISRSSEQKAGTRMGDVGVGRVESRPRYGNPEGSGGEGGRDYY